MSRSLVALALLTAGALGAASCGTGDRATPSRSSTPPSTEQTSIPSTTESTTTSSTTPATTSTEPPTTPPPTTTAATTPPATTPPTTAPATTPPPITSTPTTGPPTTTTQPGPSCTADAIEDGLPYPGLTDPSMIVRFTCAGEFATVLAQPPTDAPRFVLLLIWSGIGWVAGRDCHHDVIGVADCLADYDPALVDVLALVGDTHARELAETDPYTWAATCSTPSLREGDSGVCVAKLQTLLAIAGFDLEVDGRYGPVTDQHVRTFQTAGGLEVDGLAGSATWAALADAATRPTGVGYVTAGDQGAFLVPGSNFVHHHPTGTTTATALPGSDRYTAEYVTVVGGRSTQVGWRVNDSGRPDLGSSG